MVILQNLFQSNSKKEKGQKLLNGFIELKKEFSEINGEKKE